MSRSQRRHRRYQLGPGNIKADGLTLSALSTNLSQSGAFLPCQALPELGAELRLSLCHGVERLRITARVVRKVATKTAQEPHTGVGVEFTRLCPRVFKSLTALLARLDSNETPSALAKARGATLGGMMTSLIHGTALACKTLPSVRAQLDQVEVLRDIRYGSTNDPLHRLDVYRPKHRKGALPGLVFLHGGGFRCLTKETYFMLAAGYAHRGYVVFLPNYRLAPRHPFPAAHEDAARAYSFALTRSRDFGVAFGKLGLAGDSAGANLALALAVACTTPRPEPWARELFDHARVPHTVSLLSSLLQVRQPERLLRGNGLARAAAPGSTLEQLEEIERTYLGAQRFQPFDMADPLCMLESLQGTERALPPLFSSVGGRDALLSDTHRLEVAYRRLGGLMESHVYPEAFHAFQPVLWRDDAQQSFADAHEFLARHLRTLNHFASSARIRVAPRVPLEALQHSRTSSRPPPPSLHP